MRGSAALAPRMPDNIRVVAGVVIGLHVVARVIPTRPQELRKPPHAFGDRKARAHLLRAERGGITTGNQARPRRRTNRRTRKRPRIAHTLLCQPVNVWRHGKLVAVTSQHRTHVLRRNPEDIWPIIRPPRSTPHQQQKRIQQPLHFDKSLNCMLRNFTQPEWPSVP